MRYILNLILLFLVPSLFAQELIIQGTVTDKYSNEPLPNAVINVEGTTISTLSDLDGNYKLVFKEPGLYNLKCDLFGYEPQTLYEISVTTVRATIVNFKLEVAENTLQEVSVSVQTKFEKKMESPVSINTIGINEIQRNPGGNQDISKVIQSLPGVASGVAFRNDIIVRGGGPNENKFYLDGIEIPAINHFATQGSSGGPVGMINVNFIREVDFYSGAFPANRGNTLSSLMELKLKDGRSDRIGGIFQVGASDIGLTLEGPLSKNTTFLASARRSYLQFLFGILELPFLPIYNDFQFKTKTRWGKKHQLTVLGLGAIDNFSLNLDANETPEQQYILNNLPVNEQWNYSIGAKYTYFNNNGYTDVVLSRFMLNNIGEKFVDNNENLDQLLDYESQEIENKLRIEHHLKRGKLKLNGGVGFEQIKYNTRTFDKRLPNGLILDYESEIESYKYSFFGQASQSFLNNRLDVSAGFRVDGLSFSSATSNPLDQFSPRISASYNLTDAFSVNANYGIYYQLPPYTTLGYRDAMGMLTNKDVTYIQNEQFVFGFAYLFDFNAKLSIESFYKRYNNYPMLYPDTINLANLGGDFGVVGVADAESTGEGRAYGVELSYQQKLYKGFFGLATLTLVKSEFTDKNGDFVPSSWDNQLFASVTMGKKFKKNWEVGIQYQFLGGTPYTPYDVATSSLITNWDNIGVGLRDYNQLNTERLESFNRINLRVDKKWYFNKVGLDVYFDIQNLLGNSVQGQPFLDTQKDANGNSIVDPNDPTRYLMTTLPNSNGTAVPSIGLIIEF